jgi:hypothetical protein
MVASGFYPTRNGTTAKKVVSSGPPAIGHRRILVFAVVPSPRVDGIPLIR